ncbi:MAG: hypothetical protein A2156_10355 [Deltaproteobacteria bacterium RBG_16_48_10]|nr:MAG: hypothetical protein A2156_10355 [Deltaproteobacteria bacterium RBG_16_48_10]
MQAGKATGPSGIAGLPKQKKFCRPVVYVNTGLFYYVFFKGGMHMVLGKICQYYQNSKCLYKNSYCDLFCSQMKYYGEDESDRLEEETSKQEKSNSTRSKKEDPFPFL